MKYDAKLAAMVPANFRGKTLTIPMYAGNPPLTFTDSSGKLVGVDEDLADAVATILGLKFTYQNIQFPTLIPGLQSDRWQLTFGSLNPTPERLAVLDIIPIQATAVGFLTASSGAKPVTKETDLCGMTVAVVQDSSQLTYLTQQSQPACQAAKLPAISISKYGNVTAALLSVSSGHNNVFANAAATVLYEAKTDKSFAAQPLKLGGALSGAALPANSPLSKSIAAAFNSLIDSGNYLKIVDKWGQRDLAIKKTVLIRGASADIASIYSQLTS